MFIKDTDLIDVTVYYKKMGHRFLTYTENEFKKATLTEEEKKEYSSVTLKMKELTWGLYNELQEEAMREDTNGNSQFNVKIYKENRLLKLIKEWDAVGEGGNIVPINSNSIAHLAPDIAETILRGYDQFAFVTKEEEGK